MNRSFAMVDGTPVALSEDDNQMQKKGIYILDLAACRCDGFDEGCTTTFPFDRTSRRLLDLDVK